MVCKKLFIYGTFVVSSVCFWGEMFAAPLANTNELVWIDGATLPQEGRAFHDTATPYRRIGKKHLLTIAPVNGRVADLAGDSSGICYRFVTDAEGDVVSDLEGLRRHILDKYDGTDMIMGLHGAGHHHKDL